MIGWPRTSRTPFTPDPSYLELDAFFFPPCFLPPFFYCRLAKNFRAGTCVVPSPPLFPTLLISYSDPWKPPLQSMQRSRPLAAHPPCIFACIWISTNSPHTALRRGIQRFKGRPFFFFSPLAIDPTACSHVQRVVSCRVFTPSTIARDRVIDPPPPSIGHHRHPLRSISYGPMRDASLPIVRHPQLSLL